MKFSKYSIFENTLDYNRDQYLREYREFYIYEKNKKRPVKYEYIIWGNAENLLRMTKSYMVHRWNISSPRKLWTAIINYVQRCDNIGENCWNICVNERKNEFLYNKVLESLINILTENGNLSLNVKCIIIDNEISLINSINKNFNKIQRIACYYNYKLDILRNLKSYGLYT